MRTTTIAAGLVLATVFTTAPAHAATPKGIELTLLGRSEAGGAGAAEITAYDALTRRVFVVNAQSGTVDVLDIRDPRRPRKIFSLATPGANSVAVHGGVVAVAQQAADKTAPGTLSLFSAWTSRKLREVTVGSLPDMVTFSSDGRSVIVANEGEPESYCEGQVDDPEGSVSIVDVRRGTVRTADFRAFNGREAELRARGVRISGPGSSAAQDFEPEYVTTEGNTAWVTLQENNAVATIDLRTAKVSGIQPLGLKDFSLSGMDASDKDGKIDIRPRPVKGMYMPDAIAHFRSRGQSYLVTANEGDSRDWGCHSDEVRVKNLELADPGLKKDAELGRLTVATDSPKDAAGVTTDLLAFGARSITVRTGDGALVWDSGDELEQLIARELPEHFNADHEEEDSFDSRSDNKGPEPEGVTVGQVRGRTYAFAGLERIGGVVAYDVTDPRSPKLADYLNTRDFAGGGDTGPEGVTFVPAVQSPTFRPLLIVGNEISGTTAIYEVR